MQIVRIDRQNRLCVKSMADKWVKLNGKLNLHLYSISTLKGRDSPITYNVARWQIANSWLITKVGKSDLI